MAPSVASYQGANLEEIYRMQATHVLAWKGGNKHSDISKLKQSGHLVYESESLDIRSWIADIQQLASFINADMEYQERLIKRIKSNVEFLKALYANQEKSVFYYLSDKPLVALGKDSWLNDLLSLCNLNNVFEESFVSFPQVTIEQVVRKQPEILIASNHGTFAALYKPWQTHQNLLDATLIQANPDKLHRFTPRALDEITSVCEKAYTD